MPSLKVASVFVDVSPEQLQIGHDLRPHPGSRFRVVVDVGIREALGQSG